MVALFNHITAPFVIQLELTFFLLLFQRLIVGDTLRTTSKYSVSMYNYKNNNVEGSDSQKRQLEVLATARKMEKRQNLKRKMGKRQNGAVALTDYC